MGKTLVKFNCFGCGQAATQTLGNFNRHKDNRVFCSFECASKHRKRRKHSEETVQNALYLYTTGLSANKIGKITGIATSYVKDLLHNFNVETRPSGFRKGNDGSRNRPLSEESRQKISKAHKLSGHKPSQEAVSKGQPKTIQVRWGKHVKDPIGYMMNSYIAGAKTRNLCFELTREEFETLVKQDCAYCGTPPQPRTGNGHAPFLVNGVDRVDNDQGYLLPNCLPCCKMCNAMKLKSSKSTFIEHCKKVANHAA